MVNKKNKKNRSTIDPRMGKKDPLADLKASERRKKKLKEQGSFLIGGRVKDKKKPKKPLKGNLKRKPKPGSYDYQLQETMKPNYKGVNGMRMGGGMMQRPIMASEGQMAPRGPNRKVNKDAMSPEELRKRKRKSIDAMRPRDKRAPATGMGMRTGGICRGMGAALRGGDFKGVK